MGRLSHLTTVGLTLVQTQTWRAEDYCRLFEHLSRRLFKEGIIRNIQQYLSALCKESYPCPPPRSTLSLTSLPPRSLGRLRTRFREGHLPISVSQKTQKAERLRGTGDGLNEKSARPGLITDTDVFVFSMAAWLMMNDFLVVASRPMRL